jgi:hypothetical protein
MCSFNVRIQENTSSIGIFYVIAKLHAIAGWDVIGSEVTFFRVPRNGILVPGAVCTYVCFPLGDIVVTVRALGQIVPIA